MTKLDENVEIISVIYCESNHINDKEIQTAVPINYYCKVSLRCYVCVLQSKFSVTVFFLYI